MKNLLEEIGAILILGFIFWVIAKMETAWRGRSHIKNASDGVENKK